VSCSCGCAFCGWCLADCERDAHPHVLQCPSSANPGTYYGSFQQFEKTQNERRRNAVQHYLESLPPEDASQVRCAGSTGFAPRNKSNLHCDECAVSHELFFNVRCEPLSLEMSQTSGFLCSRRACETCTTTTTTTITTTEHLLHSPRMPFTTCVSLASPRTKNTCTCLATHVICCT
jgi:hypothetical protein